MTFELQLKRGGQKSRQYAVKGLMPLHRGVNICQKIISPLITSDDFQRSALTRL